LYERAQFPVIAMAMGIVLGPIIEQNLRGALMLPEPVWKIFLARPISAAFLVLSVLIVALGVYRALAAREGMDKPSPENS
jgi:putative tricarboxylic transport membrane protein